MIRLQGAECMLLKVDGGGSSFRRNVKWSQGGIVFQAHRLVYHLTLCSRVIKKKKKVNLSWWLWKG